MSARRTWPVLVLAALLGLANLVATPAFWPVDETAHVAYATSLVDDGHLPEVSDPIPDMGYPGLSQRLAWERDQYRFGRQDIWTANHPPLPYAVQGVALAVGRVVGGWIGAPHAPLAAARLVSVAWLVAGVWATMRLAFLLAGARPAGRGRLDPADVAVAAGTLVAATPTLTHLAGVVFNDVPAFTMSTTCLLVGARAAFAGLDRRRVAVMGLVAGAAALTRVSCLPAVAVMGVLGAYGWWRSADRPAPRQLVAPAVLAIAAVLPAAAFWTRNVVLYGDVTASATLLAKFDRDLNDPVGQLVGDRFFWLRMWDRMWADLTTGHWAVGPRAWLVELVLVVVLLAIGVAVLRGVLGLVTGPGPRLDVASDRGATAALVPGWVARHDRVHRLATALAAHPRRVVWVVGSLLPLALLASAVQFHAAGGSLHGRYVLGGHALVATGIVVVVGALPRIGRVVATALVLPIFAVQVALVQALLVHGSDTWDRIGISLALPSLAGRDAQAVTSALLVAAGAVLVTILLQHRRPRPRRHVIRLDDRPVGRYGVLPRRATSASAAR